MKQSELIAASEHYIRQELRKHLPQGVGVYLFGSRARQTARWNSDYDLWVDADVAEPIITKIIEELEESFVPFKVDIVTTPKLRGRFGECVRTEAKPWM
jgi:predicted nucleotidyltransferase